MSDSVTTPLSPLPMPETGGGAGATPTPQTAEVSAATVKFKSCRWRRPPEDGPECCGHRDVLPIAGTTSFDPQAWCPDCSFYKLRRTPKKRDPNDYHY
jgi:hypothetical protein